MLFFPPHPARKGQGGLRTLGYSRMGADVDRETSAIERPHYPSNAAVTMITVVLNGARDIEKTMLSVMNQSYGNIEYFIIDGGSTDGTLKLISKYEHGIDYWVSEPDEGISDAFNKGIRLAKGDIIGLLNCGDVLMPDAVSLVVDAWRHESEPGCAVVCGRCRFATQGRRGSYVGIPSVRGLRREMTLWHAATFVTRSCYLKHGVYRTDFSLAMDYELLLRLSLKEDVHFIELPEVLASMADGGASARNWQLGAKELLEAKKTAGVYDLFDVILYWYRLGKGSARRMIERRFRTHAMTKWYRRLFRPDMSDLH